MKKQDSSVTAKSIRLLLLSLILMLPTMASAQSTNIKFADEKVKTICVDNWDTNGDGELSYDEAAAVTDLGLTFNNKYGIASFDELQYFTGLTSIGQEAFSYCISLTSVNIPSSVKSIEYRAFYLCCLSSVNIPSSVERIGYEAFALSFQADLSSITVDEGNEVYDSRNGCSAIIETASNTLILGSNNTIIPSEVSKIDDNAFYQRKGLKSVDIPSGVTSIGRQAFSNCIGLTSVTIPSSVTTIGDYAFFACSGLTDVTISEGVTKIGDGAFRDCTSLKSVAIPSTLTSLVSNMHGPFTNCPGLTSITVDENNKVYDSRNGCNAIIETLSNTLISGCQNTVIPLDVTSIASCAFRECSSLTSITIPSSVTSIGNMAFYLCSGLTSINIPEGLTCISEAMFFGCSSLTSITIPTSVTSIGNCAFMDCNSLTSVTIPSGVRSIGYMAFYSCTGLTSVTSMVKEPFEISSDIFEYKQNEEFTTATLYVIAGTKKMYEATSAWNHFQNIEEMNSTNIQFADANVKAICVNSWDINDDGELSFDEAATVTTLEDKFSNNSEITSFDELQYFTGLARIEDYAFYSCSGLTSITIPNSVISIGRYAFSCCSSLASVTIPNSVTTLDWHAFSGCTSLASIAIPNTVTSIGDYVFTECSGLTSVSIPNTLTRIGLYVFYQCSSLTSVTIPNSVTSIGWLAFGECSGLTSLTIGNSVTSIETNAFYGCSGLTSVTIPKSVTSISGNVFQGCSGLTSIEVESGNAKYDSRNGCNAIIETNTNILVAGCQNTIIPNSVASIGSNAFLGCSGLTSIAIPNSVTSIGGSAFSGCCSLTSVAIPNTVTSIDEIAFSGCSSLTSVTIPNSVTSIGSNAFSNCIGLTSITIPSSVTSIGLCAFACCDNLTEVISNIVEPFPLEWGVFISNDWYNYSSATLYVPAGTKSLYEAAEGWRNFPNIVEMKGLEPVDEDDKVDYGDNGDITEETDLTGTVIDNMYYSIGTDAGGYSTEAGCIVITKETSDEQMEALAGMGISDAELNQIFTGIIFKVPAGKGKVTVNAETTGNMTLKVKVGNGETVEMELSGRLKMKFPYNVSEESLVYIFAGTSDEGAARSQYRTSGEESSLRIYGIEVEYVRFGDVNGDGTVDIVDVTLLVNHLLGGEDPTGFNAAAADIDGIEGLDANDLNALINIVLKK